MKWHIKKDEGWVVVSSKNRPHGNLAHLVSEKCLNWTCGKIGVPQYPSR